MSTIQAIVADNETYQFKKFSTYPRISVELKEKLSLSDEQCDYLRVFDSNENHVLLHYITSNYNNVPKSVVDWRGVIVNIHTGKIVAKSFPFTKELVIGQLCDFDTHEQDDGLTFPITVSYAYEGTIIRIFDGNFSTHHFIDGTQSKWQPSIMKDEENEKGFSFSTPRTFYEIFFSLVGQNFMSKLNPKFCYVFLLSCDENRLVNMTPNEVIHLTTFNENMEEIKEKIKSKNILYPHSFTFTKEELFDKINNYSTSSQVVGYICKTSEGMVKLTSYKYHHYREIRGNEPNILIQYLSLKKDSERKMLEELYPEYVCAFDYIKTMTTNLLTFLVKAYDMRYIKREYLYLTPPLHYFVSRAMENFIEAPELDIAEYLTRRLEETSGKNVYTMISNFSSMMPSARNTQVESSECEEKNIATSLFK